MWESFLTLIFGMKKTTTPKSKHDSDIENLVAQSVSLMKEFDHRIDNAESPKDLLQAAKWLRTSLETVSANAVTLCEKLAVEVSQSQEGQKEA